MYPGSLSRTSISTSLPCSRLHATLPGFVVCMSHGRLWNLHSLAPIMHPENNSIPAPFLPSILFPTLKYNTHLLNLPFLLHSSNLKQPASTRL